jgi:hypothetical protein
MNGYVRRFEGVGICRSAGIGLVDTLKSRRAAGDGHNAHIPRPATFAIAISRLGTHRASSFG